MALPTEVHSFQTEVGGDERFFVTAQAHDCSVIADADLNSMSAGRLRRSSPDISNEL